MKKLSFELANVIANLEAQILSVGSRDVLALEEAWRRSLLAAVPVASMLDDVTVASSTIKNDII